MARRHARDQVLFAYDGSEHARNAIHEAARQLRPGRRGIVLTVWDPLPSEPLAGGAAAWGMVLADDLESEAMTVAREGATLARSLGFDAAPLTQSGNPIWQCIVDSAAAHGAGIVVMGSHGRSAIGLVLMGSVAAAVAHHTERPVLITHASRAGEPDRAA